MIWAFEQKVGSAPAKLVLLKLADNANDKGECFPSLANIARHTELNKRTVERHLKALEAAGLLSVRRQKHESGVNLPNTYKLEMHREQGVDGGSGTQPLLAAESHGGSGTESSGVAAESRSNLSDRTSQGTGQSSGARATRLPDDWCPKLTHYDLAKKLGLTAQQVDYEADKFRDHFASAGGQNARKRDWDRTFNNWLRKAAEYGKRAPTGKPSQGHRQGPGSPIAAYRDLMSGQRG
jgi:DNA-binding transcriptional ArsR family regulator